MMHEYLSASNSQGSDIAPFSYHVSSIAHQGKKKKEGERERVRS